MAHPNWKQEIRSEFQTSVYNVVKSFADSGYSKVLTSSTLGICEATLKKYSEQVGIEFRKQVDMRDDCKPRAWGRVNNPWGRKGKIGNVERMVN